MVIECARATESMWRSADSSTVRDHHRRGSLTIHVLVPSLFSPQVSCRAQPAFASTAFTAARATPLPVARATPPAFVRLARLRGVRRSKHGGRGCLRPGADVRSPSPLPSLAHRRRHHRRVRGGSDRSAQQGPRQDRYMNLHKSLGVSSSRSPRRLLLRLTTKIPAPCPDLPLRSRRRGTRRDVRLRRRHANHRLRDGVSGGKGLPFFGYTILAPVATVSRAAPSNCTNSSGIITNSSCPCTSARSSFHALKGRLHPAPRAGVGRSDEETERATRRYSRRTAMPARGL